MPVYFLIAAALQTPPLFQEGNWTVSATPDAVTDREEVHATLSSPAGQLVFMCTRGERSVLAVEPREFLGGPLSRYELRDTWVRFDGAPAQMASWKYFDSYATPYSEREMADLLTRMRGAARLIVRLTRYDQATVDVAFDLAGATAALAAAQARC